ncbi:hypothetical protein GGR51DRAFT_342012 [Nemania sp. FL0031]|nr:hypothetical protein GGR51DRAFT_342012 [Nemania sp. FL0031]
MAPPLFLCVRRSPIYLFTYAFINWTWLHDKAHLHWAWLGLHFPENLGRGKFDGFGGGINLAGKATGVTFASSTHKGPATPLFCLFYLFYAIAHFDGMLDKVGKRYIVPGHGNLEQHPNGGDLETSEEDNLHWFDCDQVWAGLALVSYERWNRSLMMFESFCFSLPHSLEERICAFLSSIPLDNRTLHFTSSYLSYMPLYFTSFRLCSRESTRIVDERRIGYAEAECSCLIPVLYSG